MYYRHCITFLSMPHRNFFAGYESQERNNKIELHCRRVCGEAQHGQHHSIPSILAKNWITHGRPQQSDGPHAAYWNEFCFTTHIGADATRVLKPGAMAPNIQHCNAELETLGAFPAFIIVLPKKSSKRLNSIAYAEQYVCSLRGIYHRKTARHEKADDGVGFTVSFGEHHVRFCGMSLFSRAWS